MGWQPLIPCKSVSLGHDGPANVASGNLVSGLDEVVGLLGVSQRRSVVCLTGVPSPRDY